MAPIIVPPHCTTQLQLGFNGLQLQPAVASSFDAFMKGNLHALLSNLHPFVSMKICLDAGPDWLASCRGQQAVCSTIHSLFCRVRPRDLQVDAVHDLDGGRQFVSLSITFQHLQYPGYSQRVEARLLFHIQSNPGSPSRIYNIQVWPDPVASLQLFSNIEVDSSGM